jgi:His/Glu/Gln/Arg/opine family amino acid ABC transporter permease subunit
MFFDLLDMYGWRLYEGWLLSLELIGLSMIIGFSLSLLVAFGRQAGWPWIKYACKSYILFFRGTPMLVQLFLIYYGLSQFQTIKNSFLWEGFLSSPYWCAVIAMSLNAGAYMAEILRGGIKAVPPKEIMAAYAFGMSTPLVYRRIILPQAFRFALPNYNNEMILLIKASALCSTITLMELTGVTRTIIAQTYAPIELYTMAGVMYLLTNFTVTRVFRIAERLLMPYAQR